MDDDEGYVELNCSICDQSAYISLVAPVAREHAMNVWSGLHQHSREERQEYRRNLREIGFGSD